VEFGSDDFTMELPKQSTFNYKPPKQILPPPEIIEEKV